MGQELEAKKEQSLSAQKTPRGFDNFDIKDLIVPRIRLLQGLSKAVTDGEGKMGQFQDSLTNSILPDKLELVLLNLKNGAVYFKKGQGLICKSNDGITSVSGDTCSHCPFHEYWATFKENGVPPGCSGSKEFLVLVRSSIKESPYPMILSFIKTSYGMGKRLASMARLSGDDIFAQSYIIGSEKISNEKGTFAQFTIKQGTKLTPDEKVEAEKWFEMMSTSKVVVHDEKEEFISEV